MTSFIIRNALAIALLYGVYTETGIWTAIAIGLLIVGMELLALAHKVSS